MENHHFSWENPLFLWSFSIAMLNYQRVLHITSNIGFQNWLLMSCCGCCGPPSSPEPTDGGCSRCLGITKEARTWLPLKQNLHNVRWNDGKIISIYFNLFQSISTHINHVFQLADVSFFKRNHSILDLHLLEFQAGWEGARESAWEIQEKGPGAARKIHGKIPDKSRHLVWDLLWFIMIHHYSLWFINVHYDSYRWFSYRWFSYIFHIYIYNYI